MKRIALKMRQLMTTSAFIISLIVAQFAGVSLAHAAIPGDTWTGAGDGINFSNASNWSTNAVPVNGDNLIFNNTNLTADQTLNNDISSLSIGILRFNGTNTTYKYTIQGNSLTVSAGVDSNNGTATGSDVINLPIVIAADGTTFSFPLQWGANSSINTQAHSITITSAKSACLFLPALLGNGTVTIGSVTVNGYSSGLNFADSSAYTGAVTLSDGTANISKTSFPSASGFTVSGDGILELYAASDGDTIATPLTLSGTGSFQVQHVGTTSCGGSATASVYTGNLTSVSLASNFTYNGTDNAKVTTFNANGHTLNITSSGKVTLPSGVVSAPATTNTYSDSAPTAFLQLNYNETATLDGTRLNVNVVSGSTLKGTGSAKYMYIAGIIAPGHSPGTLTVTQTLTLAAGSTYQAQLQTAAAGGYDQIQVSDPSRTTGNDVNINPAAILDTSLYPGYNIKKGDQFTIINNLQPSTQKVLGTFSGLPEGTQFTLSGITFSITYVGGDGNDVVLTALSAGKDPTIPNTGAQALKLANPAVLIGFGLVSATVLFVLARRRSN